jgi:phosphopentomutase
MLLDLLQEAGQDVIGVGKIPDIFSNRGFTRRLPGQNNQEALESTVTALAEEWQGLIFANLVDFDMLYGHRLDLRGYAKALEVVDAFLPILLRFLKARDLLIFTADHGCDPAGPSTDHSREYVPILATGPSVRCGVNLGSRATLADVGASIAENFGLKVSRGTSFLKEITSQ